MVLVKNSMVIVHMIAGNIYSHHLNSGEINKISDNEVLCVYPDNAGDYYYTWIDTEEPCKGQDFTRCNREKCF